MVDFELIIISRVIHVLGVVVWIGGVAMVTMVIIPAIRKMKSPEEQIDTFEQIEGRFAQIAKVTTMLTALTGFYMMHKLNAWQRYLEVGYWWVHAMTLVWVIFTLILFVFEPLFLHKIFGEYVRKNPRGAFAIIHQLHWVLLILSLLTIAGAVAGCHGWLS